MGCYGTAIEHEDIMDDDRGVDKRQDDHQRMSDIDVMCAAIIGAAFALVVVGACARSMFFYPEFAW